MTTSLGLLEVAGLALAIEAADIMAKAANIRLAGIKRTNGSGWMLVSLTGDVAAVKAAIANGAELARRANGLVAQRVIARPAGALDAWFAPLEAEPAAAPPADIDAPDDPVKTGPAMDEPETHAAKEETAAYPPADIEPSVQPIEAGPVKDTPEIHVATEETTVPPSDASQNGRPADEPVRQPDALEKTEAGCNLCHDPACPRRKGEPRAACLHYQPRGNL